MTTRTEKDSLGEKAVPDSVYYGIQTCRALENFPVSGQRSDPTLIYAYTQIKKAAAVVNEQLGVLDNTRAAAIIQACNEILSGNHADQFVVDVFQAGAGTSLNMNLNEVIANRALELLGKPRGAYDYVSPNDHVNACQSTNDTFPTAMHLAILAKIAKLRFSLDRLASVFEEKGKQFYHVIKAGRTHLQDAVPMRLGQEFRAYGSAIRRSERLILAAVQELYDIPIGGTAIGTGLNARPGYREKMVEQLSQMTGFPLRSNHDLFEGINSQQPIAAVSAALRSFALECIRIGNDLILLNSGPATGLGEIRLPPIQPGSSIMPAKYNPGMPECLIMIGYQVMGNDSVVAMAVQGGRLELNVLTPLMIHNILQSVNLLDNFLSVFITKCIEDITVDEKRCRDYAERTAALGTIFNPTIGYAACAELIKESLATTQSIRDLVIQRKMLTPEQIDELLEPGRVSGI